MTSRGYRAAISQRHLREWRLENRLGMGKWARPTEQFLRMMLNSVLVCVRGKWQSSGAGERVRWFCSAAA